MATWRIADMSDDAWDLQLAQGGSASVFQSAGWARFKRGEGWEPFRAIAEANGKTAAFVQFLIKRMPLGVAMAWAPGAPVLQTDGEIGSIADLAWSDLFSLLRARAPLMLARLDSYVPRGLAPENPFGNEFRRPMTRIGSGASIGFDLRGGEDTFVSGMTSKHRYYLRKAQTAPLQWRSGSSHADIAALVQLHGEMSASKNLHAISEDRCRRMCDALGADGMTVLTGFVDERPVTSCMTLNFARRAFYYIAATGAEGRKLSAAYAMLPQLAAVLHEKGIQHLDFGGVAPASAERAGVDHFKKGFGGEPIEYLGEWEAASVPLLGPLAGLMMRWRGIAF